MSGDLIVITGVAGFIGSAVARKFIDKGFPVVGVDDLSSGHRDNIPYGVDFIRADLALPGVFTKLPGRCSHILHLAGQSSGEISYDDPVSDLKRNTASTLNLIQYGIRSQAEKILYASSMSVYGEQGSTPVIESSIPEPLSCYGVGKLAAENYLKVYSHELPYLALRMFNVYGPGQDLNNLRQGMVSIFVAQALRDGNIQVKGALERFRDFIYIDDVVDCWLTLSLQKNLQNQVVNIGTGLKTTVEELLNLIVESEQAAQFFVSASTPGDQTGIVSDTTTLRRVMDVENFWSLKEGLAEFIAWCRGEEKRTQER